jgi:hypothetical protein
MSASMFRMISRSFATALTLTAIITLSCLTEKALAERVVIAGTSSASDIKGKCGGGTFNANSEGYSCVTSKGSVGCNWDGKCIGECDTCGPHGAAITRGKGAIFGILSGTTLKAGTNTRPVHGTGSSHNPVTKPITPMGNHPILERNGGGGGGGKSK